MKQVIVVICDDNFVHSAIHTIKSVKLYGNFSGDILLLAPYLSEENKILFQDLGCIIKIQSIQNLKNLSDYPDTVMLKYFLFSKFFKKWDRVMYLDADTSIICDLSALFSLDGFNAVYDCSFSTLGTQICHKHILDNVPLFDKFPDFQDYDLHFKLFNVGVFIFDTNTITDTTFQELILLNNKFAGLFYFPEQAILNIYFHSKVNFLPMYYNNYVGVFSALGYKRFIQPNRQFGILHFCGKFKHFDKKSSYYDFYLSVLNNQKIDFEDVDLNSYINKIREANLDLARNNMKYSKFHKCFYLKHAPIAYDTKKINVCLNNI